MEIQKSKRVPYNFTAVLNSRATLKSALERFYAVYNPEKIGAVDSILDSYACKEKQLLEELCEKYDVSEAEFGRVVSLNSSERQLATAEASGLQKTNEMLSSNLDVLSRKVLA